MNPLLRYCLSIGVPIGIAESEEPPYLHIVQKWLIYLTVFVFYLTTVLYFSFDRDTNAFVCSFHSFLFSLLLASLTALNRKRNEVYWKCFLDVSM